MKIILTNKILLYAMMAMLLAVASCNDDDEVGSSEIELLSFGPTGAKHGESIQFIGRNLDQVTAVMLPGVEVPQDLFVSQSKGMIELVVPDEAETGKVVLMTPKGEITSKTILSFNTPFTISSISSAPDLRAGGSITIKGEFLNWVEQVWFSKDVLVEDFEKISFNEIVVNVPKEAQTGTISILGGGTDPMTFESEEPMDIALPVGTSVAPLSVRHSGIITITGENLDLVTKVVFSDGLEVVAFENQSESQLEVKVPNAAVDGNITMVAYSGVVVNVENPIGIILPNLTGANPSSVVAGETWIITGTDLDLVGEIMLPGVSTPITDFEKTPTQIVVTVPDGAFNGLVKVRTVFDFMVNTQLELKIEGMTDIPLKKAIYDDALQNGFTDWSWVAERDFAYTERVREGEKAIKVVYGDWDGFRIGGGSVSTEGMTELVFSIYGGEGLENDGKLGLMLNNQWGIREIQVTIGQWTDVTIPLSELPLDDPTLINDFALQGKFGHILIDKIGLR